MTAFLVSPEFWAGFAAALVLMLVGTVLIGLADHWFADGDL